MPKKQTSSNNITWTPVVAFYFRVSFLGGVQCNVSFSEINGLDIEMVFDEQGYPTKTKHPDLVLTRAMNATPDDLSKWIKQCTDFDGFIKTCNITICLVDEKGAVVAVWHCTNAYPKKMSVSPFKADDSKLVIETLTLVYDHLERKK